MIESNTSGFTELSMYADNGAEIFAVYDSDVNQFFVREEYKSIIDGFSYDRAACLEAVEFFTMLAEELERREKECAN